METRQRKSVIIFWVFLFGFLVSAQKDLLYSQQKEIVPHPFPVVLDSDTLFSISNSLGPFNARQRASGASEKLSAIIKADTSEIDSLKAVLKSGMYVLMLDGEDLFAVTDDDAALDSTSAEELSSRYVSIIKNKLFEARERYGSKNLIEKGIFTALFFFGMFALLWVNRKIFPWFYKFIESKEGKLFRAVRVGKHEILKDSSLTDLAIVAAKGIRLIITLAVIYYFILFTVTNLPWTRNWNIQPVLKGILLTIFITMVTTVIVRGISLSFNYFLNKIEEWKGTLIKPFKLKSIEILSVDRSADIMKLFSRIARAAAFVFLGYFYVTLLFSFFPFSSHWSSTLFDYVLTPVNSVIGSIISFLPNLFFIIVIVLAFNYLLKFVKYIFSEIEKENLVLPSFPKEWSDPTYKIVRFLILILAAVVIFPYLPGSDSEFFKGISVFIGILFSLGSSSAIANVVAGVVLTYMRAFKLGDRVKIADTTGDVIEKTLLVTRLRTVKNVDVTIPNAMVLGSHIINFSSSASDKGLILHTAVTIGYDVPWKKVHELLISAASETGNILAEPKPFVLQTSLDDFYVSYELNAYTDQPGIMSKIYSELHSKIQDKFNEAGVEIMSPHYSAVRDGNQTTIPDEYLPKNYQIPAFRFLGVEIPYIKKDTEKT